MLKNFEIREQSRARLSTNWGKAALITLTSYAIIQGSRWLAAYFFGMNEYFSASQPNEAFFIVAFLIISALIAGPIFFGVSMTYQGFTRGEKLKVGSIFQTFDNRYLKVVGLNLLLIVYIFLWMLLLIIPGIIKLFSYALAPYIMKDNPEMTPNQAITMSRLMMKGNKGKLFWLSLSFLGWLILTIFTFGVGFLWLGPYVETSMAIFYEDVKNKYINEQMLNCQKNAETHDVITDGEMYYDTKLDSEMFDDIKIDPNMYDDVMFDEEMYNQKIYEQRRFEEELENDEDQFEEDFEERKPDTADGIRKCFELLEQGIITHEEFNELKRNMIERHGAKDS